MITLCAPLPSLVKIPFFVLTLPGFECSQIVWEVVDATKFFDDNRCDTGRKFWLELRKGHFWLPTDAFAIIFNQNIGLNPGNHILPGLIWASEGGWSLGEAMRGKHSRSLLYPSRWT